MTITLLLAAVGYGLGFWVGLWLGRRAAQDRYLAKLDAIARRPPATQRVMAQHERWRERPGV